MAAREEKWRGGPSKSPQMSRLLSKTSRMERGGLFLLRGQFGAQNDVLRGTPYFGLFRHKSCVNLQPKIVFFRQDSENVSVDDPAMKRQNGPEIRLFLRVFCLQN